MNLSMNLSMIYRGPATRAGAGIVYTSDHMGESVVVSMHYTMATVAPGPDPG
jgi:hypothetical protein